MRNTFAFEFLLLNSGLVLAQNNAKASKQCPGWHLRLGQDILTYPGPVVQVSSTITAQVIPYVTEYEDGRRSTTLSTVTQHINDAAPAAFTQPVDTPLTWQASGLTLTYPTTYLYFNQISGGPNVPAPTPAGASACSSSITDVRLPSALNAQSLLFPVGGPVATAAAAHSVVDYLNSFPDVVAQFDGTNMKDCTLAVAQVAQRTAAAFSAVTKVSVAVVTQTGAPVVVRSAVEAQKSPDTVVNAVVPNAGVARPAVSRAQDPAVAVPAATGKLGIGLSQVDVVPGPNSAVIIDHSVTIAPGVAGTVNGVPVSLQANGASFVIGGTKSVVNPIFAAVTGLPAGAPVGAPLGAPVGAPTGIPAGGVPGVPGVPAGGFAGGVAGGPAVGAGAPFAGGMLPFAPFPTGVKPPAFTLGGQDFAPVTALYVAGQYLLPGATLLVSNTTYSLPTITPGASSLIVINNVTSTLPNLQRAIVTNGSDFLSTTLEATATQPPSLLITAPPALVVNGRSFAPLITDGQTLYPISPGQTVTPGKKFTLAGTRCSLDVGGTALVVGSSTYAMQSTLAWVQVKSINMTAGAAGMREGASGLRSLWLLSSVVGAFVTGALLI